MSSGPTLCWVHGWGANPAAWGDLPDRLNAAENVFADFAALDRGEAPIACLRRQFPTTPFIAIGWSLGAMLALDVAAAESDLPLRGIVVIAGSPCFCAEPPERGWHPRFLRRLAQQVGNDAATALSRFADQMFTPAETAAGYREDWRREVEARGPDTGAEGLLAGLDYLASRDLRPELERLRVPILWLHGTADAICPRGCLEFLPAAIRVRELPDAGHVPFRTQVETTSRQLQSFIHEQCH